MGQRDISPSVGGKRSSRLAWSIRCNSFLSVLLLLGASLLLKPLSAASSSLSVTSGNGTTTYAIHMMVPLTDSSQNQTQVLQWISSAMAAAENVTNQWRSTTGNSLEIYVLDNQGNAIINTNNAISSSTNASAITLLACGSQAHPDFVDEVARIGSFFHVRTLDMSYTILCNYGTACSRICVSGHKGEPHRFSNNVRFLVSCVPFWQCSPATRSCLECYNQIFRRILSQTPLWTEMPNSFISKNCSSWHARNALPYQPIRKI